MEGAVGNKKLDSMLKLLVKIDTNFKWSWSISTERCTLKPLGRRTRAKERRRQRQGKGLLGNKRSGGWVPSTPSEAPLRDARLSGMALKIS